MDSLYNPGKKKKKTPLCYARVHGFHLILWDELTKNLRSAVLPEASWELFLVTNITAWHSNMIKSSI